MEASISFVVQTIGDLLTREATSLLGVKDQIEDLQRELVWMQGFLKVANTRKVDHDEVVRTCIAEIRELAYDAEDVIETFALKTTPRRRGGISNFIKRSTCILNEGWLLFRTKSEIEKITARITKLTQRLQTYDVRKLGDEAAGSSSSNPRQELRRPYPHIVDDNVVGLDDDIKKLVSVLINGESDHKVVSICGMGGLGKTTLAKKIHRHHQVVDHFHGRLAWVYVSQQFQTRRVWEDILSGLKILEDADKKKREEELVEKLYDFLKENKCLVILDDIWSTDAWDTLKPAFPGADDTNSKFLLTSRNKEILSQAVRRGYLYELECLNDKESWELFQRIAFAQDNSTGSTVDPKKTELGKQMVPRCAGLPLAIIVLGGILTTKNSAYEWQMVFENVESYLKKGRGSRTEDVLALSYNDLPPYLRPCFLYLSAFPEDYEIGVERLIQLWVAEGIIVSSDGGEMMEDVAADSLDELLGRCMVQVGKRGPTLKIETIRMHDLMREMCLSMAKKENFLCIIEDPSISPPARRIVAHQPISFVNIRSCPLRSILFFADPFDEDDAMHKEIIASSNMQEFLDKNENKGACIPILLILWVYRFYKWHGCWRYLFNNFKSLRVLTFEGSSVDAGFKLPKAIGNLTHLRFLSLKGFLFLCSRIPSTLGNLRCLQTLDLRIDGDYSHYVPDVIWKLEELRHLYLPDKMNSKSKLKLHTLKNLLTLVNFNTNNCFIADFSKLKNLRKLKMHVYKKVLEDNLPIITSKNLQSLSIRYHGGGIDPKLSAYLLSSSVNLGELTFAGQMEKLPEHHHFSSSISYICFKEGRLEEDPMPTLEKLPNLRILEFHDFRINGEKMVCSAPHFPKLESLTLSLIRNLEEWKVEEGAMPTLCHLKIRGWYELNMLPDGLRSITTLQELKIERMRKQFRDALVDGGKDFYKVQHVPSIIFSEIF